MNKVFIIDEKKCTKFFGLFFLPSIDTRTDCGISVGQAKCTQPIITPQNDRYVKINRNVLSFERFAVLYTLSCQLEFKFMLVY